MLWFSVWTVLVLATLGGAFLLGRRLWRSGVALATELGRAAEVAEQLAVRVDELQAAAAALRPDTGPNLFDDPVRDVRPPRRAARGGGRQACRAAGPTRRHPARVEGLLAVTRAQHA